jgi:hypothetical protein
VGHGSDDRHSEASERAANRGQRICQRAADFKGWCFAVTNPEEGHVRRQNHRLFERVASDVLVLRKDDSAAPADFRQPVGVLRILREVLVVGFYPLLGLDGLADQLGHRNLAQAAIDEEDERLFKPL